MDFGQAVFLWFTNFKSFILIDFISRFAQKKTGVRSVPESHKNWVINDDININSINKSNVKVTTTNESKCGFIFINNISLLK